MTREEIATLFAERDQAARALALAEAEIKQACRQWSAEHGYLVPVRPEALRQEAA